MDILYLLVGCSIAVAVLFLGVFAWAVRSGQFDDTVTPAHRMLFDRAPGTGPPVPQPSTPPSDPAAQPSKPIR